MYIDQDSSQYLFDGAISSATTAGTLMVSSEPILPIIVGILAPVIKEVLFRFVDKITAKIKTKKAR
jgi:uncharacterized membrane protein